MVEPLHEICTGAGNPAPANLMARHWACNAPADPWRGENLHQIQSVAGGAGAPGLTRTPLLLG
jgi:hypothetical protein